MANETLWDVDVAGPGTTTTWDGDTTFWDKLPDVLRIDQLALVCAAKWRATVKPRGEQ